MRRAEVAGRLAAALLAGVLASAQAQAQSQSKSPARISPDAREATSPRGAADAKGGRGVHECLAEPAMVANVGSPIDGVLEVVAVDRGDTVRRGQVVARLQSGVEAASVELARARVEFGRRKMERNETLYQKQLISVQEKDEMETETRLREQELKKDEEQLKLRTIVSPFDGVVVERRLVPGDLVRADKSVVLKLAQIDPLNVEVVAPATLFGSVKVGMSGTVTFSPLLPGSFSARVAVVDRVVDAASGTFGVRLRLPNPGNRIPAGIKCSVQFAGQ
jgi:RND family efflux transporter MFP subunit